MKSKNFRMLHQCWPELEAEAAFAEKYLLDDPSGSLVKLRRFCEMFVHLLYEQFNLKVPFANATFFDLLMEEPFRQKVPVEIIDKFHLIRQKANRGAHARVPIDHETAQHCLREAWDISRWWYVVSGQGQVTDCPPFDPILPQMKTEKPIALSVSFPYQVTTGSTKGGERYTSSAEKADSKDNKTRLIDSLQFDTKKTEDLLIDRDQAGYCASFHDFLHAKDRVIIDTLTKFIKDPSTSQINAWRSSINLLRETINPLMGEFPHIAHVNSIILEYTLPLESRRIDALLLLNGTVLVIEFKGELLVKQAHIDQAAAYARDMRAYHKACAKTLVKAALVFTRSDSSIPSKRVSGVDIMKAPDLLAYLTNISGKEQQAVHLDRILDTECYRPLPSLIKAARELFYSGNLTRIHRAATETGPALEACTEIIKSTAQEKRRALILICGVPGAGKTLVGLQLAHSQSFDTLANDGSHRIEPANPAVFLSGNEPLVEVLQYELRSAGGGGKTFVRGVHDYVKTFTRETKPIPHQILIYDEAQRAFDAAQVAKKHLGLPREYKGLSEPELFIQFAERVPSWYVVVGLIGTGQEIHIGEEAGLQQWQSAILQSQNPSSWDIFIPRNGTIKASFKDLDNIHEVEALELTSTIRFHLATELYDFVELLLDGKTEAASAVSEKLRENHFNLFMTHDFDKAKQYLHDRYLGDKDARYGIITSSRSPNRDLTNWIQKGFNGAGEVGRGGYGQWYTEPNGPYACTSFSKVATEFATQGLELDSCLLVWGTDFIRVNGKWTNCYATRYSEPDRVKNPLTLRKNTYRVLLTRGRDGCVIFVPPIPNKMRETYAYLKLCGITVLD